MLPLKSAGGLLRNAGKHAEATSVRIEASESAGRVLITIADDGVGFPPAAEPPWTIASSDRLPSGRHLLVR